VNPKGEYSTVLKSVSSEYPRLASFLAGADANRGTRLTALGQSGRQLQALEEILTYVGESERHFIAEPRLARLAFLLHRAGGDFVTAIEAMLSAFHKTVLDAMRDVMEIEFLFRDFAMDPQRIDEWLTASERVRHSKFRPAILRQRYATSRGKAPPDMPEATDYKGHSLMLHVLPYENPIVWAAPGDARDPIGLLVCLYDIFEHARRLVGAVDIFCQALELAPPRSERFFKVAPAVWAETQQLWDRVAPMLGGSAGSKAPQDA
jgi:hypothetical protein